MEKISLGVVIVILLLLGSVAFLVGTTSGLHLVFKAADRWVPGLGILARSPAAGAISPCLTFVMSSRAWR